ncbi:MAG: MFS transporter [Pseudomonadota bacterium]
MRFVIQGALRGDGTRAVLQRSTIIALTSFFTLIDLFGSQALLPKLVTAFDTDLATMGLAVNASTFGMAISGLVVGWYSSKIDRKRGIWLSLVLLSIPTALLGVVTDVYLFMALRVLQGVFMAAAFTLSMTYLSEQCDITAASGAMAAYITGNVASNLFGRLLAVGTADAFSLEVSFFIFAGLNLVGGLFAYSLIGPKDTVPPRDDGSSPLKAWKAHLSRPELGAGFVIGFLILLVFVGVYTYVNFHLVTRFSLSPDALGLVYLVFIPSLFTTPFAAPAVRRFGPRPIFWSASAVTSAGIAATLAPSLPLVLIGLALIGMGTFFAQAAATGFIGKAAKTNHAAANGLYLTSYYIGGLVGAFSLGALYQAGAWPLVAMTVAGAMVIAAILAIFLKVKAD